MLSVPDEDENLLFFIATPRMSSPMAVTGQYPPVNISPDNIILGVSPGGYWQGGWLTLVLAVYMG